MRQEIGLIQKQQIRRKPTSKITALKVILVLVFFVGRFIRSIWRHFKNFQQVLRVLVLNRAECEDRRCPDDRRSHAGPLLLLLGQTVLVIFGVCSANDTGPPRPHIGTLGGECATGQRLPTFSRQSGEEYSFSFCKVANRSLACVFESGSLLPTQLPTQPPRQIGKMQAWGSTNLPYSYATPEQTLSRRNSERPKTETQLRHLKASSCSGHTQTTLNKSNRPLRIRLYCIFFDLGSATSVRARVQVSLVSLSGRCLSPKSRFVLFSSRLRF